MEMAKKDGLEGRCPACRSPYDKDKINSATPNDHDEFTESGTEKKQKFVKGRVKATGVAAGGGGQAPPPGSSIVGADVRKHLANVRVVQRNLVYVVGMPYSLADEETLVRKEYFGQYGKVVKIAVSRSNSAMSTTSGTAHGPTANVYVTFFREEDAVRCIQAVDGCMFEGRTLRACFGTTKYCNAWLKNLVCPNPDCLYLHEVGTQEDSYTKEEMLHRYNTGLTSSALSPAVGLLTSKHLPQYESGVNRRAVNGLPPPVDGFIMDKQPAPTFLAAAGGGTSALRGNTVLTLGTGTFGKGTAVGPSVGGGAGAGVGAVGGGILPPAASWGAKGGTAAGKLILSTPKPYTAPGAPTGHGQANGAPPVGANAFNNASVWPSPALSSALYSSSPPTAAPGFGPGSAASAAGLGRTSHLTQQHTQQFKPSATVLSSRVIQASAHSPPVIAGQPSAVQPPSNPPGPAGGSGGKSPYRERQRKSPPSPMQSPPPPSSTATLASNQATTSNSHRGGAGGKVLDSLEAASFAAAAAGSAPGADATRLPARQTQAWPTPPGIASAAALAAPPAAVVEDATASAGHVQRLSDVVSSTAVAGTGVGQAVTAAQREGGAGASNAALLVPPGIAPPVGAITAGASPGGKGGGQGTRGKSRLVVLGHTGGASSKSLLSSSSAGSGAGTSPREKLPADKGAEVVAETTVSPASVAKEDTAMSIGVSSNGSSSALDTASLQHISSASPGQARKGGTSVNPSSSSSVAESSRALQANQSSAAPPGFAVPPGFGPATVKARGVDDGAGVGKSTGGSQTEKADAVAAAISTSGGTEPNGSAAISSERTMEGFETTPSQHDVQRVDWSMPGSQGSGRYRDPSLVDWQTPADTSSSRVSSAIGGRSWRQQGEQLSSSADSILFPTHIASSAVSRGSVDDLREDSSSLIMRMAEVAQQLQQRLHEEQQDQGAIPSKENEWSLIEGILEMPLKNGGRGTHAHRNGSVDDAQDDEADTLWDASWLAAAAISTSLKVQAGGEPSGTAAAAAAALVAKASASPKDPVAGWLLHSLSMPPGSRKLNGTSPSTNPNPGSSSLTPGPAAAAVPVHAQAPPPASSFKQSRFSFARNSSGAQAGHQGSALPHSMSFPHQKGEEAAQVLQAPTTLRSVPEAPPGFSIKKGSSINAAQNDGADTTRLLGPEVATSALAVPPGFKIPTRASSPALPVAGSVPNGGTLAAASTGGDAQSQTVARDDSSVLPGLLSNPSLLSTALDGETASAAATAAVAAVTALSDGPSALTSVWQTPSTSTSPPFSTNGMTSATCLGDPSAGRASGSLVAPAFSPATVGNASAWDFASSVAASDPAWSMDQGSSANQGRGLSLGAGMFPTGSAELPTNAVDSSRANPGDSAGRGASSAASPSLLSALSRTLQAFSTAGAAPAGFGSSTTSAPQTSFMTSGPSLTTSTSLWLPGAQRGVGAVVGEQDADYMQSSSAHPSQAREAFPGARLGQIPHRVDSQKAVNGPVIKSRLVALAEPMGTSSVATDLEPWQLLPETDVVEEVAVSSAPLTSLVGLGSAVLPGLLGKTASGRGLATTEPKVGTSIPFKATSRRVGGGRYGFGLEPEDGAN